MIVHNFKYKDACLCPNSEYRDQGLTRPKALIVVPFRESALRIVKMMASLMTADQNEAKTFITNKKRFLKEYGTESDEPIKGNKPGLFKPQLRGASL